MSVQKLGATAKGLMQGIMGSYNVPYLARVIGGVVAAKKKKSITAGEYGALLEIGAKKEKLLQAEGKG